MCRKPFCLEHWGSPSLLIAIDVELGLSSIDDDGGLWLGDRFRAPESRPVPGVSVWIGSELLSHREGVVEMSNLVFVEVSSDVGDDEVHSEERFLNSEPFANASFE